MAAVLNLPYELSTKLNLSAIKSNKPSVTPRKEETTAILANIAKVLDKNVASVLLLRALTKSPMLPLEVLILANSSRDIFPSVAANQIS